MLMLDDDHPDVEEFIEYKRKNPGHIDHANLSVCISDRFMEAVKNDEEWVMRWEGEPHPDTGERDTIERHTRARDLWRKIAESAWAYAEPGIFWRARAQGESNTRYFEEIVATNPCGEIGLNPWGVCNLGALNLVSFVKELGGEAYFDYEDLAETTRTATRFLDDVIDGTHYPFPENREAQQEGARRIGLGTMGLADVFIRLAVRYGSQESLALIDRIFGTIRDSAYEASAALADEKGPFPKFDREKFLQADFVQRLPVRVRERIAADGIRNALLTCNAPTGTTSGLAGVNSGIEPVFAFVTRRTDRLGEHVLYHPLVQEWKDAHPDEELPAYFVASGDLTPHEHVRVQARIQHYIDQAVSKTTNGPSTDTVEMVEQLYMDAYDLGCKGITYYRQGSRDAVLETVKEEKPKVDAQAPAPVAPPVQLTPKKRPEVLSGQTRQVRAPEGKVNITLNCDPDTGALFEVFINLGKAGSDIAAMAEALGRLISFNLQMPSPMSQTDRTREMIDQLRGIGGSRTVGFGPNQVKSLPDGVGLVLDKYVEAATRTPLPGASPQGELPLLAGGSQEEDAAKTALPTGAFCPSCRNATMVRIEGCRKCETCGHSEC